jgi:hypothetical protein
VRRPTTPRNRCAKNRSASRKNERSLSTPRNRAGVSFGAPARSVVYSEQRSNSGEQGSMNRALLIALAGLLMTMGCSQADPPAEHQQRREGLESAQ